MVERSDGMKGTEPESIILTELEREPEVASGFLFITKICHFYGVFMICLW